MEEKKEIKYSKNAIFILHFENYHPSELKKVLLNTIRKVYDLLIIEVYTKTIENIHESIKIICYMNLLVFLKILLSK